MREKIIKRTVREAGPYKRTLMRKHGEIKNSAEERGKKENMEHNKMEAGACCTPTSMTFGQAIEALKQGKKGGACGLAGIAE